MSANDKLAATFGPGRTTPTPTHETQIAEILAAHTSNVVYYIDGGGDEGHIACHGCDWQAPSFSGFHEHVAAVLAPVIAEAKAEAIREVADKFQTGDWFNVIQGNAHVKIGNGQRVTDWLRARADKLETL